MSRLLDLHRFLLDSGAITEPLFASKREEDAIIELERCGLLNDPQELLKFLSIPVITGQDWEREPVSPREFLDNPYYCGESKLYPKLQEDFCNIINQRCHEVVMTGSIGFGKTFCMSFIMMRLLYELSCLIDPQRFCGIERGTPIVFVNLSVTGQQAKNAMYFYVQKLVDNSPYFQEHFQRDKTYSSFLKFPKDIIYQPGTSSEFSVIGANVLAGAIDEANFLVSTRRGAHEKLQGETEHAIILYRALKRRIESRYKFSRGWKGMLMIGSSKMYEDDFVESHIKKVKGQEGVYVMDYAHWDVRDPSTYSGETFKVAIGSSTARSTILAEGELVSPDVKVIEVPVEYRESFELDLDGAIRDIAGQSVLAESPFIPDRKCIHDQVTVQYDGAKLLHPFEDDTETGIYVGTPLLVDRLCESYSFIEERKRVIIKKPLRRPDALRYIHIDLALNNDSAGMAMGYVAGFRKVRRKIEGGTEVIEDSVPIIVFELLVTFIAPIGGEIEFAGIRKLLYQLREECHFQIGGVSFDQYQSSDSQQILEAHNFTVTPISVDRDLGPYTALKNGIREGWIHYYEHQTLLRELVKLRRTFTTGKKVKVDHPERDSGNKRTGKGSKDLTDCCAGVVWNIMNNLESLSGEEMVPLIQTDTDQLKTPMNSPWEDPNNSWLLDNLEN